MNFPETEWLLHKAHYEELLQIAAEQRLARQGNTGSSDHKTARGKVVNRLATPLIRWGCKQLPTGDSMSATCRSSFVDICPNMEPGDAKLCC